MRETLAALKRLRLTGWIAIQKVSRICKCARAAMMALRSVGDRHKLDVAFLSELQNIY